MAKITKIPMNMVKDYTVNNIADLRAATGNFANKTVKVLGYDEPGDGGGGPDRYFKSGGGPGTYVDNGGSVVVPSGGDGSAAWLWKCCVAVNIKWFGAVGDNNAANASLNASSMQAAIDFGAIAGVDVFFPAGTYLYDTTLIIPSEQPTGIRQYRGSHLRGDGNILASHILTTSEHLKGTVLLYTGTTGDGIYAYGGNYNIRGLSIKDMSIGTTDSDGWAIRLWKATERALISRVTTYGLNGIQFNDMWDNCKIEDCAVKGLGDTVVGGIGIALRCETIGGGLNSIVNCTVADIDIAFNLGKIEVTDVGVGTPAVMRCQAIRCNIGVNIDTTNGPLITGSHFENALSGSILFAAGGCETATIIGNRFSFGQEYGINCNASASNEIKNLTIIGNSILVIPNNKPGIFLNDSTYVSGTIEGNFLSDWGYTETYGNTHLGGYGIYSSAGDPKNIRIGVNTFFLGDYGGGDNEDRNIYNTSDFAEFYEYNKTAGYADKVLAKHVSLNVKGSTAITPASPITAQNVLWITEGTLFEIDSTTLKYIWSTNITRNDTGRDIVEGTIIRFFAMGSNTRFDNNSTSAGVDEYKFMNIKTGGHITTVQGQIVSYILKSVGGVMDWYEL